LEQKHKEIDLLEWESLFRHPNFEKVTEVLSQRIENLQLSVDNRAKTSMNMNTAFESAGDLRVVAEFRKILQLFNSLKQQILQNKGVK
jgi:hypothetical protein